MGFQQRRRVVYGTAVASPDATVALSGVSAVSALSLVGLALTVGLSGANSNVALSSQALTGIQASTTVGTLSASAPGLAALTGVQASMTAGTVVSEAAGDAAIITEAIAANSDTVHPLPLVGVWEASDGDRYDNADPGFAPAWQLDRIDEGRRILPTIPMPNPADSWGGAIQAYYTDVMTELAARGLPICLFGTQWEYFLLYQEPYISMTYPNNPQAWVSGAASGELSPFGPSANWTAVGNAWGAGSILGQLQALYPNPPLVIFLSNNEIPRKNWTSIDTDQHYLDLYSAGASNALKRERVGNGFVTVYSALIAGFRASISTSAWRNVSKFIGYNAAGRETIGRFSGWDTFALEIVGRIDPWALAWDGASPQVYLEPYVGWKTDFRLLSPQMECQNQEFMRQEALTLNADFWWEYSVWSGVDTLGASDPQDPGWYSSFTPTRYQAWLQFCMWIQRPRLLREFQHSWESTPTLAVNEQWFTAVCDAVDLVWDTPTLVTFWRNSALVDSGRQHPYNVEFPSDYASVPRMFMLATNLDPIEADWTDGVGNPELFAEFPVFAMARVRGTTPTRDWLVYAHSPLQNRTSVVITIPTYQNITVDVPIAGAYYLVHESDDSVTLVA